MGCASSLSNTPAPPQGQRSQHPGEGHTTHVTSYSVEHGHTTYCSSGTERTRKSHSPDHDLIFHIDTLSMLSQTSSLTLRSQKTMIKACQPSGNFQSQFNYGVENEVVHDNAAKKSQLQGVACSNFEDHIGSTKGFLLPTTHNSIRMGHEAATSTYAHTQAPSSSLTSGGLIMQQHRMPYFMASISQSGPPAATFIATAPPVKTCTVVFPPSGSSLVGAPSLRFKVTSGGLKEEGEYLREVSTNNHSHNHANRFSIGASETASGHLGHVHNRRHSFNTVHSPISRSPWENAAFTTTCHCADESHNFFSSPSSVQMAFTTACNDRQRDNTANGLNNRVSSTHSIYSPVMSCPSRRRGATHAGDVSAHMCNEKDFPSSHTIGMEEWPQGVVAGCECHRRYMVAQDHNAADSSNRHNRDKGVGTEEGYLSEADKDTVRRINSRRRKQVTLSSDPWSLEHYRRGTFFIPDNDSYYDASGVELIVNRCEYVVLPPSARPSPQSFSDRGPEGFQCQIGANAAHPLQQPLASDSIPAMCDCCSTEEGAPHRCSASVPGVAVVGGRHALPKPIELSPLVGPQDGNRPRDLMQMTSAIFDLSGRSGGETRGSHGDLSLENMSCFLLERSQNSGNTQGAGNAGQNSVPATIRHDAAHTRGELPDAVLYDSLTPPYPAHNTIKMTSPHVRVLKSSLKQHHQMHAVHTNKVHSPSHNHVWTNTTHEVIGGGAHPLLQPESDHNVSVFSPRATAGEYAVEHCPPKLQPTDGRHDREEAIEAEGTTTNAEAERVPDTLSLAQIEGFEGCYCGPRKELLEMGEAEKQPSYTDTDDETKHYALHLESISGGDKTALSSTRNVENDKGGAMMLSFLNVNCNNNSSLAQPDSTGSPLSPTTFSRPKPSPSRFAGKLSARLSLSFSISKESFGVGVGGSGQEVGPFAKGQHADEDKKHEYNEENQDEKFAKSAQGCCPMLEVTSDYLTKNTITSTPTASDPQEFEIIREVVRNDAAAENVLVASMTTTSSVDFTAATNAVHTNSLNTTMRTETYQSNFSSFTTTAAAAPAAATATTVTGTTTKEMSPIDDEVPARGTPLGSASPSVRRKLTAARSANNLLSTHLTLSPRAEGAIIKRSDFPTPTARALTQTSAANTGSSPRVKPNAAATSVVLTLRRSASCGAALCEKMDSKDAYSGDEDRESSFSTGFFPNGNDATGNDVVGNQTSRRQEGFGSLTSFDGTVMEGALQKECFSKDNCACGALVANQDLRAGRRGLSRLKWDSSSSREGVSSVHFHQGDKEGETDNLSPTATTKGIAGVVGNGEPPNFSLSPSLLAATEKEMNMEIEGEMETTHQLHFRPYYNNTNSERDIRAMTDCEEGRDMCDNLNANSSANVENGAHSLEQLLECPELKSQSLSSSGVTLILADKASRPSEGTTQALASAFAAPSKKGKETRPIVANLIIDANDEDRMADSSQAHDIFIINNDCNTNNNNDNNDTNNSSTTLSSRCSFSSVPQSPLSSTKMSFRRRALLERGVMGALSPPDNVNSSGGEKTNEEFQSPLRFLRNEAPDSRPVGEQSLLHVSSTCNTTHKSRDNDEGVPATSMVIKAGSESSSFEGGRKHADESSMYEVSTCRSLGRRAATIHGAVGACRSSAASPLASPRVEGTANRRQLLQPTVEMPANRLVRLTPLAATEPKLPLPNSSHQPPQLLHQRSQSLGPAVMSGTTPTSKASKRFATSTTPAPK